MGTLVNGKTHSVRYYFKSINVCARERERERERATVKSNHRAHNHDRIIAHTGTG